MIKTISILGCGWFGLAFAKKLVNMGYTVKGSTTTTEKLSILEAEKIQPFIIDAHATEISGNTAFFDADVLFICIPPKRNSPELASYPEKISATLSAAKQVKQVVLISSTSVYGDENNIVNEDSETYPDTDSGKVVLEAEAILKTARPDTFTIIRFAGLIGPDRNPGRFFAGKTDVPNGLAPVNLIHQQDAVGLACTLLIKEAFRKIYNACAPQHPTRKAFYTAAAKISDLTEPVFVAEKKDWKVVESLNVPRFLDYKFEVEI